MRNDELAAENSSYKSETQNLSALANRSNAEIQDLERTNMELQTTNSALLDDLNKLKIMAQQFEKDLEQTQFALEQKETDLEDLRGRVRALDNENHQLNLKVSN